MKRNAVIPMSALIVVIGLGFFFKAGHRGLSPDQTVSNERETESKIRKKSKPTAEQPGSDPKNGGDSIARSGSLEKMTIFVGAEASEPIQVEGRKILKDSLTGCVMVHGLVTITYSDGRKVRAHGPPDPIFWFDPETGETTGLVNYFTDVEE